MERRFRGREQETAQETKQQQQLKEKPSGRTVGHQRTARVANPSRPGIPKTRSKKAAQKPIPLGLRHNTSWARPDRRTVERNRRIHMKTLISKLVSLVPPQHFTPPKERNVV
ncbi:hypothetical protein M9H77_04690 [Catharanthus roseus]|uniref:Uncharacterized protein n=1 Tax=Catharanthus roseus TaxID=4058 RepID=A0ACC0CF10_CATRO|nr:hypothetical protein M9H77_04690 [Catharanthus roseus]